MATESGFTKDVVYKNNFIFHNKRGKKAPFDIIWWGYDMTSRGTMMHPEGEYETVHGFGTVACHCKSGGCGGVSVHNEGRANEPYANCSKCGFSVQMIDPTTLLINGVRYYGTPIEKVHNATQKMCLFVIEEENKELRGVIDSYLKFLDKLSGDLKRISSRVDDEVHSIKLKKKQG